MKILSSMVYDEESSREFRDINSELLEKMLAEKQEELEVDDNQQQAIARSVLDRVEEKKEEDEDEIEITDPLVSSARLWQALVSNKEIFGSSEEEKKIGFSSFTILEKIGAGAFGQVFKVKQVGTDKIYAMKSIGKDFLLKTKQIKYAQNECQILKEMNHPFVIKMHYAFQTPDYLHFILDYCEGGDLSMHIDDRQIFDEWETKFYVAELILAIEYLHSKNIIYRDLKPENLLLGTSPLP
eukprot:TRINITY_DN15872_c0_g1_i11.p1 TRINITY_DN15872_c0_g1~~TRINITY_DN15872_c0_g1_i11.p1  ORF type:complete len:240 (-),score=75.72 TRINITY_DN15872_c0_g1_i11:110-829(-)